MKQLKKNKYGIRQTTKYIYFILSIILISVCYNVNAWPDTISESTDSNFDQQPVYWYEREVKKQAWMALGEAVVFPIRGEETKLSRDLLIQRFHPQADITYRNSFLAYLKIPEPIERGVLLEKLSSLRLLDRVSQASPVFYADKKSHPEARFVLTGEIIVQFPQDYLEERVVGIEETYGLERVKSFPFTPNAFLYRVGEPLHSLKVANDLYESGQVIYAYPNWLRSRAKRATPTDTLFPDQWHLENTGQGGGTAGEDVNITSVWDTYKASSGEVVAIVDDGLEIDHEDLGLNVLSGQSYDYVDGDSDPTDGYHGTSCAGVAAGRGFNAQGITGAAPFAGLVGYRLLGAETDANEADALTRNNNLIDIYSNSWGPSDDGRRLEAPGPLTESAMESGVTNGRSGLGSIYVWAGGNGYDNDNSNYDGYANSRYTIAVAASTNYGDRSDYSEKGANILVNAPSSGGSMDISTTDRTGSEGYNPNGNYTDTFGGTSSAAPLVSGIIALIIQANPSLTWRDVQHILIETAEKNDPNDAGWAANGAGYPINHKYGFGRIDAQAAVAAALTWTSVGDETNVATGSSPNFSIPDNDSTGVSDVITIPDSITVEFVEVYFTAADHTYWGDLEVTLVSPSGTESVLSESHSSGSSYAYNNWRFGSVRHFGESSTGNWTLRVRDLQNLDIGTFQSWTLKIYGTIDFEPTPPNVIEVNPHHGAGISDDTRVPTNTSFSVRIEDTDGIDITDTAGIMFTINDGINAEYTRDLSNTDVVRIINLGSDPDTAMTELWAVYDRSKDAAYGNFQYDSLVNIRVDVKDIRGDWMAPAGYEFRIETEAEHNEAQANLPDTGPVGSDDPAFEGSYDTGIQVNSGDLLGAKIVFNSNEPVQPEFGPYGEIPTLDVTAVEIVGVPMNLQPPTVFNLPVKIFVPTPGYSDVSAVSLFRYNGTSWVLACDAGGSVQTGGEGWMVPGSRVDHNNGIPSSIEIRVYHFSGVQPGISSSGDETPAVSSDGGGGGGGGCFIATAAFGSPLEPYVLILRNFRDTYLLSCRLGSMFTDIYYKYSPPIANFITKHDTLKTAVRVGLLPMVAVSYSMLHFGPAITVIGLFLICMLPILLISVCRRRAGSNRVAT